MPSLIPLLKNLCLVKRNVLILLKQNNGSNKDLPGSYYNPATQQEMHIRSKYLPIKAISFIFIFRNQKH